MNATVGSEISPSTGVAGQDSLVLGTTSTTDSLVSESPMSESISFQSQLVTAFLCLSRFL